MPDIDVSPLGTLDTPNGRRRKRGTSIIPSLPAIFSPGQNDGRGEMVHAENGVSATHLPSISRVPKSTPSQEDGEKFGLTANLVFHKDGSSFQNSSVSYLRQDSHPRHGEEVPNFNHRGANASSIHDWLQTVESSAVLEGGLHESMEESQMRRATCPLVSDRTIDDRSDELSRKLLLI